MRGFLGVLVFVAGCGGASQTTTEADAGPDRPQAPCELPDGIYEFKYVEESGTCGPQNSHLTRFDRSANAGTGERPSNGCTAKGGFVPESCTSEVTTTCGDTVITTKLDWTADVSAATGKSSLSVGMDCTSIYTVRAVRQ